jgi:hypothetical protein
MRFYATLPGLRNTADGSAALNHNTTGTSNIAMGDNAGQQSHHRQQQYRPWRAGCRRRIRRDPQGKSSTATGTFIAGISGKTVANGVAVIVNASGQLGTVLSSAGSKTT